MTLRRQKCRCLTFLKLKYRSVGIYEIMFYVDNANTIADKFCNWLLYIIALDIGCLCHDMHVVLTEVAKCIFS